ncbi:helix-turn-helix domain-containing protein [Nocardia sp. CDC159]|uniref:Helix-turn-helix domain-containing protein n=1 Tax=Nocardia pulmonis TaxID=2951408 RepID=A0A9X2EAK0_9NOCA|nr:MULTISPECIES: helix-turn-helix domain-containing protein [Nocardia]MCM6775920.1 helix-turn-helix domain-containing protein [Nocardia pulmonis]MCM6788104.1 helix-turn-helix domain-containing protein [Nocardia sp. CDC159]
MPGNAALPLPTLAEFVKVRREQREWTQKELAERTHTSLGYVRQIEHGGKTNPGAQVLDSFAKAFQLSPAEHRHMLVLAGRPGPTADAPISDGELPDMLEALAPHAAARVQDWRITTANTPFRRLWPGLLEAPNMLQWWFGDPRAKLVHRVWRREATIMAGLFRDYAARPGCREPAAEVLATVQHIPEFRQLWQAGVVHSARPTPYRRLWQPHAGREIVLREVLLQWPTRDGRPGILMLDIIEPEGR